MKTSTPITILLALAFGAALHAQSTAAPVADDHAIEIPEVVALPDKVDDGMKCTRKTWGGGKDRSEVVLIEIENGGHTWPGQKPIVAMLGKSTMDISANDLMWEFFQKHPMKPTP